MTREALKPPGGTKEDVGILGTLFAGGMAGVTLWSVIFPADVIKSRLQVSPMSDIKRRPKSLSTFPIGSNFVSPIACFLFPSPYLFGLSNVPDSTTPFPDRLSNAKEDMFILGHECFLGIRLERAHDPGWDEHSADRGRTCPLQRPPANPYQDVPCYGRALHRLRDLKGTHAQIRLTSETDGAVT